ncbi:phage capsid protein [Paraburkholderia sacchari]|uniref:phage capsid protein n=1 Tax=Paraburkholderia sacchari TaxID=159450 RepID=UPI001BCC7A27|nr:phage capsid protein [Paraburkholderia sacchari]
MSGMVLTAADLAYEDLEKFGRVTIEYTGRRVEITVDGFEFTSPCTCREHNTKAIAWARDVLTAKLLANQLVPGGDLISIANMSQEQLEQERGNT